MFEQINKLLSHITVGTQPPLLLLLTGSSGCGKTHLATALEKLLNPEKSGVFYFDSIGVPSTEQMTAEFGSCEKWQEATTHKWIQKLSLIRDKALIIFEGQYHPKFALDAITSLGLTNFKLAVVTAKNEVWEQRLYGPRNQGYLVNEDMRNWARLLREESIKCGGAVIDTSASDLDLNLHEVAALLNPLIVARVAG